MTFALFIIAFIGFFFLALNLLPPASSYPLPSEFADGFATIVSYMKAWDIIFPISELLTLVAIVVTFELAFWLLKWVMKLIYIIRGTGTQ